LEGLKTKKATKVPVNANALFANIQNIKATQEAEERRLALMKTRDVAAEAKKVADTVIARGVAGLSYEFSIFDPIG
jgi:hypothetical protein